MSVQFSKKLQKNLKLGTSRHHDVGKNKAQSNEGFSMQIQIH
jgi:hypothetical protein